jgi:hypothetical protein
MQPLHCPGDYYCADCGLRWWIEDSAEIWRDHGEHRCDCGRPIIDWDGSRTYSKTPMFREPTVTIADLMSDQGLVPAGSTIGVSHHRIFEGMRPPVAYRQISYQGTNVRVREDDLFAVAHR